VFGFDDKIIHLALLMRCAGKKPLRMAVLKENAEDQSDLEESDWEDLDEEGKKKRKKINRPSLQRVLSVKKSK
jgi:hypothetical protein